MFYNIELKTVVSNQDNAREPVPTLQSQGYGLCEPLPDFNKPTLFALALGSTEEKKTFCSLIDAHELGIAELAGSLTKRGQLQPCRLRPLSDNTYALTFGARRALAVLYAHALSNGKQPAVIMAAIHQTDEKHALLESFDENHFRSKPSPLDEARFYNRMIETFGWTQREVAEHCGLGENGYVTVHNRLELLKLPEEVQAKVHVGKMTMTAALQKQKGKGQTPKKPRRSDKGMIDIPDETVPFIDEHATVTEELGNDRESAWEEIEISNQEAATIMDETKTETAVPSRVGMLSDFLANPEKLPKEFQKKKIVSQFIEWLLEE